MAKTQMSSGRPATPRKLGRPLGQRQQPRTGRRLVVGARVAGWLIVALGVLVVLGRLGPGISRDGSDPPPGALVPADAPATNTVAVLPFADRGASGDREYFGDGMAEEILALLARSPELRVIGRSSSFAFKGRGVDVPTIAAVLGVAHVLQGTVQVADDRVRVTAQLVSGSDGAESWSHSYDRALDEVLDIQADVAASVAGVLHARRAGGAAGASPARPHDIHAYDHYLRARHLLHRGRPGDLQLSMAHFEAAVGAEPDDAVAWAGLSGALDAWITAEGARTTANLQRRREAAERALALDATLPEAHLGIVPVLLDAGEPEGAAEHLRIARSLDPGNLLLLTSSADWLVAAGRLAEADERWQAAISRDPLSPACRLERTSVLIALGRLDEARLELAVAAELAPGGGDRVALLQARILLLEGRAGEALGMLENAAPGRERDVVLVLSEHALGRSDATPDALERLADDESPEGALGLAEVYAALGETDAAFRWLDEACARFGPVPPRGSARCARQANASPFLAPLRADARWITLPADGM